MNDQACTVILDLYWLLYVSIVNIMLVSIPSTHLKIKHLFNKKESTTNFFKDKNSKKVNPLPRMVNNYGAGGHRNFPFQCGLPRSE